MQLLCNSRAISLIQNIYNYSHFWLLQALFSLSTNNDITDDQHE